jgi:hypothetical protein
VIHLPIQNFHRGMTMGFTSSFIHGQQKP